MAWYTLDMVVELGFGRFATFWVVGVKRKRSNRLHDVIMPYVYHGESPTLHNMTSYLIMW